VGLPSRVDPCWSMRCHSRDGRRQPAVASGIAGFVQGAGESVMKLAPARPGRDGSRAGGGGPDMQSAAQLTAIWSILTGFCSYSGSVGGAISDTRAMGVPVICRDRLARCGWRALSCPAGAAGACCVPRPLRRPVRPGPVLPVRCPGRSSRARIRVPGRKGVRYDPFPTRNPASRWIGPPRSFGRVFQIWPLTLADQLRVSLQDPRTRAGGAPPPRRPPEIRSR
jgi:hypothetical protein